MANAVVKKQKQGADPRKWGIWLNESGSLSFGSGANNEVEITKDERDALKVLPLDKRVETLKEMRKPPEPEKVEETVAAVDAAAEQAAATGEPVVTATQTPVGTPDPGQKLGQDSEGHPGEEGPVGTPTEPPKETTA